METEINNDLIRSFDPCYDPVEVGIPDNETLLIKEWVSKYGNIVKNKEDIIWLLCRKEFMSDRDMRLFAVWCARESFKLQESVDTRSIEACNIAEKFANGLATQEELSAADLEAYLTAKSAWSVTKPIWSAIESAWSARSVTRATELVAEAALFAAMSAKSLARARAMTTSVVASEWSEAANSMYLAVISAQINQLLTYFKN